MVAHVNTLVDPSVFLMQALRQKINQHFLSFFNLNCLSSYLYLVVIYTLVLFRDPKKNFSCFVLPVCGLSFPLFRVELVLLEENEI